MVRAADAVEMVLNVAENEANLVEVVQVINNFQLAQRPGAGGSVCARCGEDRPKG
jgi:hypothetical protein